MLGQQVVHSSSEASWMTPQALFDKLNAVAHFDVDLAADAAAAKVSTWIGPGSPIGENALTVPWHELRSMLGMLRRQLRGFLNPPYSEEARRAGVPGMAIEEWAQKAWVESIRGFETWALLPYSVQTDWWRAFVEGHRDGLSSGIRDVVGAAPFHAAMEVWRLPYRVKFHPTDHMLARFQAEFAEGKRKSPKPSGAGHNVAVVIFKPNPGFVGPWQPAVRYWSYR